MMSLEHICYLAVFTHLSNGYLLVCLHRVIPLPSMIFTLLCQMKKLNCTKVHTSLYKKKMCFFFVFFCFFFCGKQIEYIFHNFHIAKKYFFKLTTQHFVNSPVVTLTLQIIETIYNYCALLFKTKSEIFQLIMARIGHI